MEAENLVDALDEFDARYLECYHQMTSKLPELAFDLLITLSSPLLGPHDDDDVPSVSLSVTTLQVPLYYDEDNKGINCQEDIDDINSLNDINSISSVSSVNDINSTTLRDITSMDAAMVNMANAKDTTTISHMTDIPDMPMTLCDTRLRARTISASGLDAHPRLQRSLTYVNTVHATRMHRLLLGLQLTPKLHARLGECRATVTTYVGNPFYRGRASPPRKRTMGLADVCARTSPLTTKKYTFEIGDIDLQRRRRPDLDEPVYR